MRIVFVGAGKYSVLAAKTLVSKGHEVIIIEADKERIDELQDELDCSFLHGDGGKPAILKEVNPKQTDLLFCLADNDQANIIASLLGRSLGFSRVVTSIEDLDLQTLCEELGLEDMIIPSQTISRHIVDMVHGLDAIELSTILKDQARLFPFTAKTQDAVTVDQLELPKGSRVMCYYRKGKFSFAESGTTLSEGDEVVILTESQDLPALQKRWNPKQADRDEE